VAKNLATDKHGRNTEKKNPFRSSHHPRYPRYPWSINTTTDHTDITDKIRVSSVFIRGKKSVAKQIRGEA